jgi:ribosomal protein L37AE/L43A
MDKDKPQCLYCGGFNLERQAYRIGYECLECHKFMADLSIVWSYVEKGKIRNDLDGRIAILDRNGDSFTIVQEQKVIP